MDAIERHIAAYRSVEFDERGEAWGKVSELDALEGHLDDPRVLDFFLALVADPSEYDMARIYLLKLFHADPFPAAHQEIGECVAAALPGEEDWVVRCWLSQAIACYSEIPAARDVAVARALDPNEDDVVRVTCLSGLSASDPEVVPVLQKLASEDSPLTFTAQRKLTEASEG